VAKDKRSVLDDIADGVADGVRGLAEAIDRLLNPDSRKQRALVPVPVRIPQRPTRRDPYR
jgi:hypothetical protein